MTPRRMTIALLSVVAAAGGPAPVGAQLLDPVGSDFVVPTTTLSGQSEPDVVTLAGGGFVVVWQSDESADEDSDGRSIQAQRFDAAGAPQGGEFQVNSYTTGSQRLPSVAALPTGGFVVAWESFGSAGSDQTGSSIQFRRFDSSGNPVGSDQQANGGAVRLVPNAFVRGSYNGYQRDPTVAARSDGSFIVTWESVGSTGNDSSDTSIQARAFDSSGNPLVAEFQVNTSTTGYQVKPVIATDPQDRFVVAWQSSASQGTDNDGTSIQMQRFAANGSPLGQETQVNTTVPGSPVEAAVTRAGDGAIVVTWSTGASIDTDILASAFEPDGTPLLDEVEVSPIALRSGRYSDVAFTDDDLLVVWGAEQSFGNDSDGDSIQGRLVDSDGDGGPTFQVNTYTTSTQSDPAVAVNADGTILVVWGSNSGDGSSGAVRGRVFRRWLFRDGFESGSTVNWSSTFP